VTGFISKFVNEHKTKDPKVVYKVHIEPRGCEMENMVDIELTIKIKLSNQDVIITNIYNHPGHHIDDKGGQQPR